MLSATISVFAAETLLSIIDATYSKAHSHPDSGGCVPTVSLLLVYNLCYPLIAYLVIQELKISIVFFSASLLISVLTVILIKPWRTGKSRQEVRTAWEETKNLTAEICRENNPS